MFKIAYKCKMTREEPIYIMHGEFQKKGEKGRIVTVPGKQMYCCNEKECLEAGVTGCVFANGNGINPAERLSDNE